MTKLWCLIAIMIEFKYLNDIWPGFRRIMTSITSSLFLISKCSRITSLQSLFFNFLESNVLLNLGQCMNCILVRKTTRVFSHSYIKVSPLATDYDVLTRFQVSRALFLRFRVCASHLGKGALSPIIRALRFASFPWRLALQNKLNTNPSIFCNQI